MGLDLFIAALRTHKTYHIVSEFEKNLLKVKGQSNKKSLFSQVTKYDRTIIEFEMLLLCFKLFF